MTAARNQAWRHVVTLELPQATPSLNDTRREHHRTTTKRRNMYQRFLALSTRKAHLCPEGERRRLTITRYGARELDTDNLIGGCKTLLDAMTLVGLIEDDRTGCLEAIYGQEKSTRKAARMVIKVEAADAE